MPVCTICHKQYARLEHLRRHIQSAHTEEPGARQKNGESSAPKPYHCDIEGCGRSFNRSDVLVRHKRTHGRQQQRRQSSEGDSDERPHKRHHSDGTAAAQINVNHIMGLSQSTNTYMHEQSSPKRHSQHHQQSSELEHQSYSAVPAQPQLTQDVGLGVSPTASALSYTSSGAAGAIDRPHEAFSPVSARWPATSPATVDAYAPPSRSQTQAQTQTQTQTNAPLEQSPLDIFTHFGFGAPFNTGVMNGAEAAWNGVISQPNMTGLDWILEDPHDSASVVDASSLSSFLPDSFQEMDGLADLKHSAQHAAQNDRFKDIFGNIETSPAEQNETIALMNLANTAVSMTPHFETSQANLKNRATQRDEDGGDSWPQDFRPVRSKPPTIEISDFTLTLDLGQDTQVSGTDASKDLSFKRTNGPSSAPLVLIIESPEDSEREGFASVPKSSSAEKSDGILPGKWKVTEGMREQLLAYLQHACRHPWSIYSFENAPPEFLTCSQMETLINLFFRKFHTYVPVLHPSTFQLPNASPLMLLAFITIGLVFYTSEMRLHSQVVLSKESLAKLRKSTLVLAVAFSELIRVGVMSSHEADQRNFFNIPLKQAWLFQQMFAVVSGDKRLYKIAERNRGGMITAIRRMGILHMSEMPVNVSSLSNMTGAQLEAAWKAWVEHEIRIRLGWFVFLHDQMFCCYLDIGANLRYTEISSPSPCDEYLWNAPTAHEWARRMASRGQVSRKPFVANLKRLLASHRTATVPLRLHRLEAYILAVTLYRIRWDSSKQSILLSYEDEDDEGDTQFDEDSAQLGGTINFASARALQRLAEAASVTTSSFRTSSPYDTIPPALGRDVQLLWMLSKVEFSAPPLYFDKLKDAAGRLGMSSSRRVEAIAWLEKWMGNCNNHVAMRRILLASAQVFELMRSSLAASATKPDVVVLQSNICIVSLFRAALSMWAYAKFSNQHNRTAAQPVSLQSDQYPLLSPSLVESIEKAGRINIVGCDPSPLDRGDDWDEEALQGEIVKAWVHGAYVSTEDGEVHQWDAASYLTVRVAALGNFAGATASQNSSSGPGLVKASQVLKHFAALLRKLDWGLAASFRMILIHMARHEAKVESPATTGSSDGSVLTA